MWLLNHYNMKKNKILSPDLINLDGSVVEGREIFKEINSGLWKKIGVESSGKVNGYAFELNVEQPTIGVKGLSEIVKAIKFLIKFKPNTEMVGHLNMNIEFPLEWIDNTVEGKLFGIYKNIDSYNLNDSKLFYLSFAKKNKYVKSLVERVECGDISRPDFLDDYGADLLIAPENKMQEFISNIENEIGHSVELGDEYIERIKALNKDNAILLEALNRNGSPPVDIDLKRKSNKSIVAKIKTFFE